ncbi:MAG: 8-amino-7-oxononanoate synthase [Candidatus Omnitrophica bacterium]|nr:8-amino-7-oxononanoate synthase [Candidatus Omnitrophota bacterium]
MEFLQNELDELKRKKICRLLETVACSGPARIRAAGDRLLDFSSNNYLGLTAHPRVLRESALAIRRWGTGSGASRLLSGNLKIHEDLEAKIAAFKGEEAAAVFSSGYMAALGAVTSLVGEKDAVLVDRLNHASLIDAARLSRAKFWVYPHRDAAALDDLLGRAKGYRRRLVVTDSYFSMDGDIAPLGRIAEVCRRRGALLMVDEAHATGVFGKRGSGLTEHFGLTGTIDVVMGTLSKALASVGGYVAGKAVLKRYLVTRSRQFIYTTAPSPAASGAAYGAIGVIEKHPEIRERYWEKIRRTRGSLEALGFDLMDSEGPVVPVLIGDTARAVRAAAFLRRHGIFAPAIRPPTVPNRTDRIRLSLTAAHTEEDLGRLIAALQKMRKRL